MWVDNQDRPVALLSDAAEICRKAGGHLASERDLTEAIRGGLPNGSNANLATWDIGYGASPNQAVRNMVVRWTATDPNFSDLYPTYMTWANLTQALAFRCVWSNELR
jgi:hypothetical protein